MSDDPNRRDLPPADDDPLDENEEPTLTLGPADADDAAADDSPEAVLEIYPSLVGLEISGSSLSEDRVLQAHELGLFTFFRAEVKPLDAEPKIRRGLIAGVDGFFVSEVDRFRELLSRFRQEAGS